MTAGHHWSKHATQWDLLGPPLRPSPEDTACMQGVVDACAQVPARPLRALVLGVTPELVGLRWPAGSAVSAVERSAAMIAALPTTAATAVQADWRALPCAAASYDVIVGDGCLATLAYPGDYRVLAAELARVLAPEGRVALRLMSQPEARESLADVAAALAARAIGSFHAFKWRLAMAITRADHIAVADIARAYDELVPDPAALVAHTGWPAEVLSTVENYRTSSAVYSFPTTADSVAALAPHLVQVALCPQPYELGERCPTLVLRAG